MKQKNKKISMTQRKSTVYNPHLPKDEVIYKIPTYPVKLKEIHTVGKRIKYYREKLGLEQKDIARQLGFTPNAVSNWENCRTRPDLSVVPKLCDILHITLYDLYGMDKPLDFYNNHEQQLIEDYRSLSKGHRFTIEKMIETLKAVELAEQCPDLTELIECEKGLAAGFDAGVEFDDIGTPIFLHTSPIVSQADLVFHVSGDSMEPEYHDGDMVLVQKYPGCPALRYGEVGAFSIGNTTYIKLYEEDGLHSFNENYDVMHFTEDDNVYLIGRVLGILDPEDIASEDDIERYLAVHKQED